MVPSVGCGFLVLVARCQIPDLKGLPVRRPVAIALAAVMLLVGMAAGAVTQRFADVPEDHWAAEAIEWAAANGIVSGKGDGSFDPGGLVTRAQVATMLYRYEQQLGDAGSVGPHSHTSVPAHTHGGSSGSGSGHSCWLESAIRRSPGFTTETAQAASGPFESGHEHRIKIAEAYIGQGLVEVLDVRCEHT